MKFTNNYFLCENVYDYCFIVDPTTSVIAMEIQKQAYICKNNLNLENVLTAILCLKKVRKSLLVKSKLLTFLH